jgi:hypothetical protein
MKRVILRALLVALIGASHSATAGPFADDMAKCLVNSASPADRTVLVKWIFSVITLHPDLTTLSTLSAKNRDDITKDAGALFQRLILESCRVQVQQALQNEGPQTIAYAFQVMGQAATVGLLSDPHVSAGAKDLTKYVDEEKIQAALTASPQQK